MIKFRDISEGAPQPVAEAQPGLLSKDYAVREKEMGDVIELSVIGPFGIRMKAEVYEGGAGKTLRITEFHFSESTSVPKQAPLEILHEFLLRAEKYGVTHVEIPLDAATTEKMLAIDKMDILMGESVFEGAKRLFERDAEPQRRATDPKPRPAQFELEIFTTRLKKALGQLAADNPVASA